MCFRVCLKVRRVPTGALDTFIDHHGTAHEMTLKVDQLLQTHDSVYPAFRDVRKRDMVYFILLPEGARNEH